MPTAPLDPVATIVMLLPGRSVSTAALARPQAASAEPPPLTATATEAAPTTPPPPLCARPDLLQAIADRRGFGFTGIEARPHAEELLDPIRSALEGAQPDPEADRRDLDQIVGSEARLTGEILAEGFDLWTRFTTEYRRELKTQPPCEAEARIVAARCRSLLTGPDLTTASLIAALNPAVPRGVRARLCRWVYAQDDARPDWRAASDQIEALRAGVVLRNMPFAWRGARMAYASGLSWTERTLAGVTGLMRALDTWEPDGAGNFQTYARHWLKARVHKLALEHGHPARRSNWLSEQTMRVQQAVDAHARMGEPTEWTIDQIRTVAVEAGGEAGAVERSLLPWWGDEDDPERLEDLLGPYEPSPDAVREAEEHWSRMEAALRQMEHQHNGVRRRHVVEHRFGGPETPHQTLSEIGRGLELSRERIRQIEREALVALRHLLGLPMAYPPEANTSPTSSDSPSSSS